MNTKILETLEFNKIKELFAVYLQTEQGKLELQHLLPLSKKETIEKSFLEIVDMEQIFIESPHFSIGSTRDVVAITKRLELEGDLNIEELLILKRILQVSQELATFYADLENIRLQELSRIFENLEVFPGIQGSLQAVNDGGFIENFASEELGRIRRKIQENENKVRELLQDILKNKAEMLADQVIASRNGRNVLPVKNTYRNRISGVVHDISASGTTVYIEPRAVVNLNEEISLLAMEAVTKHDSLEPADILIGVTGVYYNIPVYTHNTKHFKLIKNISLYQEVS